MDNVQNWLDLGLGILDGWLVILNVITSETPV